MVITPGEVVINLQALLDALHRDSTGAVGDEPVELGSGQGGGKGGADQIHAGKQLLGFFQIGALPQNPGDELKGSHIVLAGDKGLVIRIAHKVQPSHAQPLFVDGIVEKGRAFGNVCHAHQGIVLAVISHVPEAQGKPAGHYNDFLTIGKFIVKGAAKIEVTGLISCSSTHSCLPPVFSL